MPAPRLHDRSLTGIGRTVPSEDDPFGSFAMLDFACFIGALGLFGIAALYARACGDL
jgi:hypothetical protein